MPAGSLEKMRFAFQFGADAVYAGVPLFSLRARENEFTLEDLATGLSEARAAGKKIYLTANIFARNVKLRPFARQVEEWVKLKPDALIMSDPGLIIHVREKYPEIPVHLSVQANCMNWMAVKFWQSIGISRIILSRELHLNEIREIHNQVPDIELEAFVHGSICIAYSGRCLMSHYMSHREANQGVCDNSCRYPYKVYSADKSEKKLPDELLLQDLREPSEFYAMEEDEHGTYIMNSKDLCLIEHLKELQEAGVCSFKVEGRTKSVFYAGMISWIYRRAIDDMAAGKPFDPELLQNLQQLAHRGYHKGFLMGQPSQDSQNYNDTNRSLNSTFCGHALEQDNTWTKFEVKGRIQSQDLIEIFSAGDQKRRTRVLRLKDKIGQDKSILHPGSGQGYLETEDKIPIAPMSLICRSLETP